MLDKIVADNVEKVRTLRGIELRDHLYASQAFMRRLQF